MNKIILFLILAFMAEETFSADFFVGAEIGGAFPLGEFRNYGESYSGCDQDPFINSPLIKNGDLKMNTGIFYGLNAGFNILSRLSLSLNFCSSTNKNNGHEYKVYEGEYVHLLDSSLTKPYLDGYLLGIGVDWNFLKLNNFRFSVGLEPQLAFISYNSFSQIYYPAVPIPFFGLEEYKNKHTTFALSAKATIEYDILKNLSIGFYTKYSRITQGFNIAEYKYLFCTPIKENKIINPQWIIVSLGLKYNIAK